MMPHSDNEDASADRGADENLLPVQISVPAMPNSLGGAMDWSLALLPGDDAAFAARLMLADATGLGTTQLIAFPERALTPSAWERFSAAVLRHASGEPLAYVRGRQGFWTLDLEVTHDTLIPRPETELLVERALHRLPAGRARVVDLGTGSGAIALAIAHERREAEVVAIDASEAALAVARRNAEAAKLCVRFAHSDWFSAIPEESWDLIVSNPPYIADGDPHLQQGGLPCEPRAALASGVDGLDALRVIATGAAGRLRSNAWLVVEHGWEQGEAVRALFLAAGLVDVATLRDLEHRERVTEGRCPAF